ncbi:MAG: class IV adenylate cyclase [Candidatus Peribacteria bacterium]|nr:class IV adenylate cyclase [Candidatus Peribacteria bacterium]
MIEVEMRAKLPDNAKKTLDNLPDIQKSHTTHYQNDIYLKHTKDVDRNLVIRFRKNDTNDVLLTFKGKPSTNDDTARPEYEMKITQYEQLLQLLLSSGYERLVVIDKSRQTYTYYNMEINIDDVK